MAVMFPCFAKQERTNKKEQGKSDVEGAVALRSNGRVLYAEIL